MGFIGELFFVVVVFGTYFLPSILADRREHSRLVPIFILNFFLGWTLVGWVVALMWVYMEDKKGLRKF